jgi:hypothetical protein
MSGRKTPEDPAVSYVLGDTDQTYLYGITDVLFCPSFASSIELRPDIVP